MNQTNKPTLQDLIAEPRPGQFGTTTQSHLFLFDPEVKGREIFAMDYHFVTLAPSVLPGLREVFPTPAPDFVTILGLPYHDVTSDEIVARTLDAIGCVDVGIEAMEAACLVHGILVSAGMPTQSASQFDVMAPYNVNTAMKAKARQMLRELLGPEAIL